MTISARTIARKRSQFLAISLAAAFAACDSDESVGGEGQSGTSGRAGSAGMNGSGGSGGAGAGGTSAGSSGSGGANGASGAGASAGSGTGGSAGSGGSGASGGAGGSGATDSGTNGASGSGGSGGSGAAGRGGNTADGGQPIGALCVNNTNCSQSQGKAVCCTVSGCAAPCECLLEANCPGGAPYLPCTVGADCNRYGGGKLCCEVRAGSATQRFCTKSNGCTGTIIP